MYRKIIIIVFYVISDIGNFCFIEGQSNLINSSILVVGAGGLGSPALLYLAACGIGNISHLRFL